ncbi:DUF4340 domain-containing protein [Candidatus Sumerlaeota bacterium]|nr:DUF4340 domain-containing protein [Candidatus Sumerlaeota bacterium]
MSFKRNIFIAIFFIVILGIYLGVSSLKTKKEKLKEAEAKLFTEPEDSITAFRLKNPNGEFVLKKQDDTWYVVSPVKAKADQSTINMMLSNLAGAEKSNIFEAEELAPYGLDKPKISVTLEFQKPGKKATILFGDETTSRGRYFCKLKDEKGIFVVYSHIYNTMMKKLYDLRDKTVLVCSPDDVTSFTLKNRFGEVVAEKDEEDKWRLVHPVDYLGDETQINNLLRKVNFARVVEFVEPTTTALSVYGLDKPQIVFSVTRRVHNQEELTTTSVLLVGAKKEANYYAKRADGKDIFILRSDVYRALDKKPDKFRNSRLFTVNMVDVDKIELTREGKKVTLTKGEEQKWEFATDKQTRCDHDKVVSMLSQVLSAKAQTFEADYPESWAKYGLQSPKIKFIITDKDTNTVEGIYLGKKEDKKHRVFARKMGEDTVITVTESVYKALNKSKDDLIDKRLFAEVFRGDVQKVEIKTEKKKYRLRRKGVNWEIGELPEKEGESIEYRPIEVAKVNMLLDNIIELRYTSLVTGEEAKPETTGLDKPHKQFLLYDKKDKKIASLQLGNSQKALTYVSIGNGKIYTVSNADIKDITTAFDSLIE